MRPIDADGLSARMYHEAFEKDTDLQKWDGGCWIRYKMFENVIKEMPTLQRKPSLTDLYIRDKQTGAIHRIGDDVHDQLTVADSGQVEYYNLQNGDGAIAGADSDLFGYEFVPNMDKNGFNCDPREENNEADRR